MKAGIGPGRTEARLDTKVLINLLVELATAEAELLEAGQTRARQAVRTRNLDELQTELRHDAELAEAAERELERRLRACEAEIEAAGQTLAARRQRLETLGDDRQIAAVRQEIASFERKLADLEAQALALMDQVGEGRDEATEARRQWREQEGRRLDEHDRMDAGAGRAEALQQELAVEIERLSAMLPPDVQRHVKRLRGGLDRAVVFLESKACGACFAQLPPQRAIAAERGTEVVRCESCSRYVVHRPWH